MQINQIKFLFYSIVRGVLFMHSRGIVHRDLKPCNVLINSQFDVKICDFGCASIESVGLESTLEMTKHMVSKSFRPPEINMEYMQQGQGKALDIWSLGLILAQLFNREEFQKADSNEQYLTFLIELLGMPDDRIKAQIHQKGYLNYMEVHQSFQPRQALQKLIPSAPQDALDLISRMLTYDPSHRISAKEILVHPFLSLCYSSNDKQIIEGQPIRPFEFEFEKFNLEWGILRDLIMDEIIVNNSKQAQLKLEDLQFKFPAGVLARLFMNDEVFDQPKIKTKGSMISEDFSINKSIDNRSKKSHGTPIFSNNF